ncbi:hypothetical protein CRENBAI_007905 [Crenichthys baileyi]|uniref:Uncharacterized protein n=1 Tax=Crenichthys baileyi TaxID=28760 RepID=A0AAV9SEJ8_9TELE
MATSEASQLEEGGVADGEGLGSEGDWVASGQQICVQLCRRGCGRSALLEGGEGSRSSVLKSAVSVTSLEKARDVNRDPGWSSFSGLRLQARKVKSSDRRRAFSFQLDLPRHSPLSSFGRFFVAVGVYGLGLIHIEEAFEESTSVHLFLSSPPIYI